MIAIDLLEGLVVGLGEPVQGRLENKASIIFHAVIDYLSRHE